MRHMDNNFPTPGLGYKVREYLGGGNWKSAYRASSPYNLADVALLFFHDDDKPDILLKDVSNLLRGTAQRRYGEYLARFYGLQRGSDGRLFIVEELLARPLDGMAPLNDLLPFVRIARDLCRALTCLHESGLIHRDLKLDNCGLDHQSRAKIFDLGSVTSDGGDIRGTILTRSPELFSGAKARCDKSSDVWALGATLFALRSGDYPFVTRSEVKQRQLINDDIRTLKVSVAEGAKRKVSLNERVAERILSRNAGAELEVSIHSILRGRAEELLGGMLQFDPARRRDIQFFEGGWSALAQELGGAGGGRSDDASKWEKVKLHVRLAKEKELVLTRKQLERIISEYREELADQSDPEFEKLLMEVKEASY
jgi:serine/threonine protein kinase